MQDQEKVDRAKIYAQFAAHTYSRMPFGLAQALARVKAGRNAWNVMSALCADVFADGRLGRKSDVALSEITGLTKKQVQRGRQELCEKQIIEPVKVKTEDGKRRPDRSSFGHVAQYQFTKDTWACVELDEITSGR